MTFKADEPWTHHRLCGTHLVCTPSGAVREVCRDWSAEIWKVFKVKDLQLQKKRDYRADKKPGKTRSQSPAKAREPVLLLCWTARTRPGLRPRTGRRRRYAGHPIRPVHMRRKRGSTLPLLLMNPLLPARPPRRRQTEDVDIGLRSLGTVTIHDTVTTLDTVRGGLEVANVGLRPPSLRRQHEHQGRVSPLMARRWSSCCTKP